MQENAIKFWKDNNEAKVRSVVSLSDDGAEYYHPITKEYYRDCLGVIFIHDENRWVKFKGVIDRNQFVLLSDLSCLINAHDYISKLGGLDGANAVINGFELTIASIKQSAEYVASCQPQ